MKPDFPDFFRSLLPRLAALPGEVSVFGQDLKTGERWEYEPNRPLMAASVIKLPILAEAFRQARDGLLSMDETFSIRPEQKMPSCGALNYLHDGLTVSLRDLCVLMIILSDNTATNILIDRLGMDSVNQTVRALGLPETTLRRKLFDGEAAARGLENTVTAAEMGALLLKMYRGECVSPEADAEMLSILRDQRLNGKMPFFLHGLKIAHKTGEDTGITHDVKSLINPTKYKYTTVERQRYIYTVCEYL